MEDNCKCYLDICQIVYSIGFSVFKYYTKYEPEGRNNPVQLTFCGSLL